MFDYLPYKIDENGKRRYIPLTEFEPIIPKGGSITVNDVVIEDEDHQTKKQKGEITNE